MSTKDEVLARIKTALWDVGEQDPALDVPVDWEYGRPLGSRDVVTDFVEKVRDYGATVTQVTLQELPGALTTALGELRSDLVVLPPGLPPAWEEIILGSGLRVTIDDPPLPNAELNEVDTVVTTCTAAMADSGTIALNHSDGQGRRVLTLLPDKHLCVVRATQVVSDVPEGLALLGPSIRARRPVTWVSGGSATSDIELERVEGVHGPRTLHVILICDASE